MKTIIGKIDDIKIEEELCIALGTFDGVHYGHRKIISKSVELAKKAGIKSAVLTFDIHPLKIIKPDLNIKVLTENDVKKEIIEQIGVDYLVFLKFDEYFASIEPENFIKILKTNFNAAALLCGYNYTFGKQGHGNPEILRKLKDVYQYRLYVFNKIVYKGRNISSSIIRRKMEIGEVEDANYLLGYNYYIIGNVEKGRGVANKMGFPTANINISEDIALKNGVYITEILIDGEIYRSISNVGHTPTIEKKQRVVETYVFNFQGNLYGKKIKIEFLKYMRDEVRFESIDALKEKVYSDIKTAMEYRNVK